MKIKKGIAAIALVAMGMQAGLATAEELVLAESTPVRLKLSRTMSSADAQLGETVDFEVLDEVRVNDIVVIPQGATAIGSVTEAKPRGRLGKGGKLNITLDHVRLVNGQKVPLRALSSGKGGGSTGMKVGIAAGVLVAPILAPAALFLKGKDIVYTRGTEVTAYVNADVKIDARDLKKSGSRK